MERFQLKPTIYFGPDALAALGISIDKTLADNDAYHALKACGGLIFTGPTGTNVNDITVLLV